jgi:hypothetical protein
MFEAQRDPKWPFSEIGPALGEKFERLRTEAELGGEFATEGRDFWLDRSIAAEIGMSPVAWSKAKSGQKRADGKQEYIYGRHLRGIAAYFGLDQPRYLGPRAWEAFTPEVPKEEFFAALSRAGYGSGGFANGRSTRPADAVLAGLQDVGRGLVRGGIEVVLVREAGLGGQRRSAGVVDETAEAEEAESAHFAPGDNVVVRLLVPATSHVVLLQLTEIAHPPHCALHCLAPSYRHRGTAVPRDGVVPEARDSKGRRGFQLGADRGRLDMLALVTQGGPLPLPFDPPDEEKRFHLVDAARELRLLREVLRASAARAGDALQILHAPIRVA